MDPAILQGRLEATCQAFEALERQLADPSVAGDPAQLQTLARERARLEPIVHDTHQLQRLEREQREAQELLRQPRGSADEEELAVLAAEELQLLEERLDVLRQRLTVALLPRDPRDERSVMLEIRAGAGGDEAALWAGDLARMYERYAMAHGWQVQPLSASEAELGGFKELILSIKGDAVYSRLKFEAGVHRVQRVPATESQGRVHTSTATVAVMPEAEEVDIEIKPEDLRIEVCRAGGPGGQGVNTTDSAVQVMHIPTGRIVRCQDGRSQQKNKAKALQILRSRLL